MKGSHCSEPSNQDSHFLNTFMLKVSALPAPQRTMQWLGWKGLPKITKPCNGWVGRDLEDHRTMKQLGWKGPPSPPNHSLQTRQEMQPVRKQQEICIFGFSLFSSFLPTFFFFLPYAFCLLSAGFPRTPSLHFSHALYMNRPDYNRPALKCIITMMTVITIKHSFNRNNNNNKKIYKK